MKRHQVLTGSVNPGSHCYSVGQINTFTFWAYGSGCDLVISTSSVQPLQVISPSSVKPLQDVSGNANVLITAIDCGELNGNIAVAYGNIIVVYSPTLNDDSTYRWSADSSLLIDGSASIVSWNLPGSQLLVGSSSVALWEFRDKWDKRWVSNVGENPTLLSFAPSNGQNQLFASVAEGETMIKVWYKRPSLVLDLDFTFTYLQHPHRVTGFEWRRNVNDRFPNILISSAQDQICRVWSETKQPVSRILRFESERPARPHGRSKEVRNFHIAATINPLNDIPLSQTTFSSFAIHWLNNKFYANQHRESEFRQKLCKSANFGESYSLLEDNSLESPDDLTPSSVDPAELTPKMKESLLRHWRDSSDGLFSIHPTDGSLLVWHVDFLDEDRAGKIRQPQVCFSSRIPMAFSSGDAATLCPRILLFVNYSFKQNLLHSASTVSFSSQHALKRDVFSEVQLLSKHNDGSLNLWQLSFNDPRDLSTVTSIAHHSRSCGHCFHLSSILPHPILPLLTTAASHHSRSELILWRVDPVGPLGHSGGLSELARVSPSSTRFHKVAWVPVVFPSWCLGLESTAPSTALVAIGDNRLHVYQAVVNADQILLDVLNEDKLNSLVSEQSSDHPGCLLHLRTVADGNGHWGEVLFLEVFPETVMSSCRNAVNRSCHFEQIFLVVMLERRAGVVTCHTWKVEFSSHQSKVKGSRGRRTTARMTDSSDDSSDLEELPPMSNISHISVELNKYCSQHLTMTSQIASVCSGGLFFTSEENFQCSPYHLCVATVDGNIRFLKCVLGESTCHWVTVDDLNIKVDGRPLVVKTGNPTLLSCLFINGNTASVAIYESASSGGNVWSKQDSIDYGRLLLTSDPSNFHLDWLSREEGSFFLVVGYSCNIQVFSLAPRDMIRRKDSHPKLKKQSSLDVHTRQKLLVSTKFMKLEENSKKVASDPPSGEWRLLKWMKLADFEVTKSGGVTVSWAREGLLVVATATEMHVFCQWLEKAPEWMGDNVGLSQLSDAIHPTLQQYHPLVLNELLNSGHLEAVREILIHLAICMNGDYYDTVCQSEGISPDKFQLPPNLGQLCGANITPLSLCDLLNPDGRIKKNFGVVEQHPTIEEEPLFLPHDDDGDANDPELDEILGITSKEVVKHEHFDLRTLKPHYFGKEHCKVIHDFLVRNSLPGLTNLDQMELMALVDTLELANRSDVGVEEEGKQGLMLSACERGYTVSGTGIQALDSCGLRYVMAMHNHLCLLNSLPASNRATLLKQGLSTNHFAWAFHSEAEGEILSLLPSVQRGSPQWKEVRSLGVGWWIRSNVLMRRLFEQIARSAFLANNDPLDSALFYLALDKKSLLCGLFKSVKDKRMHTFFQNDFKEDRWRRAALKNAFALMGKQRFEQAAAFFLLAGSVRDAVEVCIEKMRDFQLALAIVRLRENPDVTQEELIRTHIFNSASDAFFRSMAHWTLGAYDEALDTLLEDICTEDIADIFNFYSYLRVHPLVVRKMVRDEQISERERQLIFQTSVVHLEAGCPILALDALSRLPRTLCDVKRDVTTNEINTGDITTDDITVTDDITEEDWSHPVVFEEEELELDWSEEEDGETPTILKTIPTIVEPTADNVEEVDDAANQPPMKADVFAQHLQTTASLKVFVQELTAIARAYNTDGGQLRFKLYAWLENASLTFRNIFEVATKIEDKPTSQQVEVVSSSSETSMGSFLGTSGRTPSLHEVIIADSNDWKLRRSAHVRRHKWLHTHHNFLRTLLSYCNLHDTAHGSLRTMRMELLLLLQESLQDRNSARPLSAPLPQPGSTIPLITSTISSCVVADPLTHLSQMTHDLLTSALSSPPCGCDITVMCSQAAALSSCIFQSLCDTNTASYKCRLLDTVSLHSNDPGTSPQALSSLPSRPRSELYIAPTSGPAQWPGVSLLQAKLSNTDIVRLFCEATSAIYVTLLLHALNQDNAPLLFRLANHSLGTKMWDAVFGGGVKVQSRYSRPEVGSSTRRGKLRERLNHKLLNLSSSLDVGTHSEEFVPPEVSLWDWFLTKAFTAPSSGEVFDSEDEDSDSIVSDTDGVEEEYAWKLMRLGVVDCVARNIRSLLPLAGFELGELSANSPLLGALLRVLVEWKNQFNLEVEECGGPPEGFLPYLGSFYGDDSPSLRPAMLRYQAMLEESNSPFSGSGKLAQSCKRLWMSLVRKEELQDTFIHFIFKKKQEAVDDSDEGYQGDQRYRVLHKEADLIATFCLNRVNPNCVAMATDKDIQELDLTTMLSEQSWAWVDAPVRAATRDDDFLFVSVPQPLKHVSPSNLQSTWSTGQGANVLLRRPFNGVKRMESHPSLPYYLTGGRDGGLFMWEWGHQQHISQYITGSAKIANLHFSSLGNKLAAVDGGGYLSMWQVCVSHKPYLRHMCHDRGASDCCFVSSSSVLATAGHSTNNKNLAIWDTLLPKRSFLVKDFPSHDQLGATALAYIARHRNIIVAGRNGQIETFDDRCLREPLKRFTAHDAPIKCLAVDPLERFYVTGSPMGDVRMWDSLSHDLLHASNNEHTRSSLFKNFGSGTVQVLATVDRLFTCGADGSLKMKLLEEWD